MHVSRSLMKTYSLKFLVCLAVSLAFGVHADSILETARPVDPLALPLVPADLTQPVSVASILGNQVDAINPETLFQDPLASVSLDAPAGSTVVFTPVTLDSFSIYQPSPGANVSDALPVFSDVGAVNSDLGSLLNNNVTIENPAIVPASFNPVSFLSPDPGGFSIQPMQVMTPEPSEFSLLVVGLAAMALIFRFSPRKV